MFINFVWSVKKDLTKSQEQQYQHRYSYTVLHLSEVMCKKLGKVTLIIFQLSHGMYVLDQ